MTPQQSKAAFAKRLKAVGKTLADMTPAKGIAAMLAFYAEQRADGVEPVDEGDMLLLQWGEDGSANGRMFCLNVTRQFIVSGEDEPYQLALTFAFEPSAELRKTGEGNKWFRTPADVAACRRFVEALPEYRAVADRIATKVGLDFGQC